MRDRGRKAASASLATGAPLVGARYGGRSRVIGARRSALIVRARTSAAVARIGWPREGLTSGSRVPL